MKKITAGIFAHVDAGKTTLSEGLLYCAGEIRSLGRVDTQNTFLDTDEMERNRGITIFSKQAVLTFDDTVITLLDTPGHTDFSAEAERIPWALDYAILVVSATDGIRSHTKTLWHILKKHSVPTFVFINKLDLAGADKSATVALLHENFGDGFVDFSDADTDARSEALALCDSRLMEEYLETDTLRLSSLIRAVKERRVYPCFGGSALKMEGVEFFLQTFCALTRQDSAPAQFGARIYKIGQDERGQRLTYMKITGGALKVRDILPTATDDREKVNEIRIYSGEKYKTADCADAGCVCAVTGPKRTYVGQGLGFERDAGKLTVEPIFSYSVILPHDVDATTALEKLKQLEQEETQLGVSYDEKLKEIQLRIMGEIQLEVLEQMIFRRFGMKVSFAQGRLVYKETIANTVEGVGHYEPLRHYAEVHLLLEPLPRGSGLQFEADCSEEILDKNWQRLIMTHLMEKTHIGVLTGSEITDIKITLKSGRAHLKHTEGGDFRQATYRAVRHGLRRAKSVLLEPYYDFELEVPPENVGRAMTDLDRMGAEFSLPQTRGKMAKISGTVAANQIRNYQKELIGYTHGHGILSCKLRGYGECKNADAVTAEIGYNCDADVENTADSVFCAHGAGYNVAWQDVTAHMHLDSVLKTKKAAPISDRSAYARRAAATDEELLRIFEKTYGKITVKNPNTVLKTKKDAPKTPKTPAPKKKYDKEYLLIDGYNIIFAWEELKTLAADSLEAARDKLAEYMRVYAVFRRCEPIVVFDAYKVKGNRGEVEKRDGISIIYTKESQTADSYIEKTAKELSKNYKVTVATSDALEQMIIFGTGAYRMPASALEEDVRRMENDIRKLMEQYNAETDAVPFFHHIEGLEDENADDSR